MDRPGGGLRRLVRRPSAGNHRRMQSSIADADMADWVTVAAYLLAAMLSARAARHAGIGCQADDRLFWRATALVLVLLAVNELLDLQALLTALGRAHAKANGWYGEHRRAQYAFVVALGGAALIAGAGLLWLTRRMHVTVRLALVGLASIGLFILVRAASFHHLDEVLGRGWQRFKLGSIQEMAGILIVAAAAALYARRRSGTR